MAQQWHVIEKLIFVLIETTLAGQRMSARLAKVALAEADLLAPGVAADHELGGVDLALRRRETDRRVRRDGAAGIGHLVRQPHALPLAAHVEQPRERRCGGVKCNCQGVCRGYAQRKEDVTVCTA